MNPSKKIKLKQKTPAGGVYAYIYYIDENDQPTTKEGAATVHIIELDSRGRKVAESHYSRDIETI